MFAQSGNWCPKPITAKTRPAKCVGKRKKLTTLNSTHTLFDYAQRAPKQLYDKQHGKAKGTISGQANARTIQHNMTDETCSHIETSRHSGRKEEQGQRRERLIRKTCRQTATSDSAEFDA